MALNGFTPVMKLAAASTATFNLGYKWEGCVINLNLRKVLILFCMKLSTSVNKIILTLLCMTVIAINVDSFSYYQSKIYKIIERLNGIETSLSEGNNDPKKPVLNVKEDLNQAKIVSMIGKKRYNELISFQNMYRDTSKQTNIIFIGDIINEFMHDYVDFLLLPFDGSSYCYRLSESAWCHIQSLDLFVYPVKVKHKKYEANVDYDKYKYLKERTTITFRGSNNITLNLLLPKNYQGSRTFYLYGYGDEIFISNTVENMKGN